VKLSASNRLLLATVVLGSIVLLLWAGRARLTGAEAFAIPSFSYWQVQTVLLEDKAGSLRLERHGNDWVLEGKEGSRVDSERVRALVSLWEDGFTPNRPIDAGAVAEGLTALGFGADARRLRMVGQDGTVLMDVDLGRRLSAGRIYLRHHGTQRVLQGVLPPGPGVSTKREDWLAEPSRPD
jgi:hypothetical protein